MGNINRIMKRRRKNEYKFLKSLFRIRDEARPYLEEPMRISQLREYASSPFRSESIRPIDVVDNQHRILYGPPKPPFPPPRQN